MSDRIHLHDVELDAHIGVSAAERASAQRLMLELSVECDTRAAAAADDFTLTVDYAALLEVARRVAAERHYALVETLAERIAQAVLARFAVPAVRVLVKKPSALRHLGAGAPAVEIERRRMRP